LGENSRRSESTSSGYRDVVLLGDSHAENWQYKVGDAFNLGIAGQTSVQVRIRSDVYREDLSGRRLIVMAGGNDLKSLSTNTHRKEAVVGRCLSSLDAIVSNHRGRFEEIVLVTVPPVFSMPLEYRFLHSHVIDSAHRELNRGIRRLAAKRKVRLLDAYAILSEKKETETLSKDGIHLNATAYRYLEAALSGGIIHAQSAEEATP